MRPEPRRFFFFFGRAGGGSFGKSSSEGARPRDCACWCAAAAAKAGSLIESSGFEPRRTVGGELGPFSLVAAACRRALSRRLALSPDELSLPVYDFAASLLEPRSLSSMSLVGEIVFISLSPSSCALCGMSLGSLFSCLSFSISISLPPPTPPHHQPPNPHLNHRRHSDGAPRI